MHDEHEAEKIVDKDIFKETVALFRQARQIGPFSERSSLFPHVILTLFLTADCFPNKKTPSN